MKAKIRNKPDENLQIEVEVEKAKFIIFGLEKSKQAAFGFEQGRIVIWGLGQRRTWNNSRSYPRYIYADAFLSYESSPVLVLYSLNIVTERVCNSQLGTRILGC